MRRFLTASLFVLAANCALAQTSPNFTRGQVPTAAQWNALFASKNDVLGFTPLNKGGDTMLGRLVTAAPSLSAAGLNLPHGTAPTSPVNGDLWTTTSGLFAQINGTTVGPLGTGGGGGGGSVTSVGYTAGAGLTLSGTASPITTTGTFTYALASIGNGNAFGNVSGGTAAPGALSPTQLTTLVNLATASLSGAVPAFPNNTTTFLRGDLSYQTLNCGALSGAGAICSLGIGSGLQSTGGNLAIAAPTASLTAADQVLSGGAVVTPLSLASGNITLDCGGRPLQYIVNTGAFSITPSYAGGDGSCALKVINGNGAGAVTPAQYKVGSNTGDPFATTTRGSATCTITIASPGVVTYTAHGLQSFEPVYITTSGALPTGLTAGTVYYVIFVGVNSFQLSATPNGSAINTSGSQSGTHTCVEPSSFIFQDVGVGFVHTYAWKAMQ